MSNTISTLANVRNLNQDGTQNQHEDFIIDSLEYDVASAGSAESSVTEQNKPSWFVFYNSMPDQN